MDFRAKHLEGVEAHEEIDQIFAVIAAAGGPTMAELQAMPISQSAGIRAELNDALMEHGDIHPTDDPAAIGWTVELSQPVGDAHTLFMREPLGRDLKTPGRTGYQHNRNLLLNLLTIPGKQPGRRLKRLIAGCDGLPVPTRVLPQEREDLIVSPSLIQRVHDLIDPVAMFGYVLSHDRPLISRTPRSRS